MNWSDKRIEETIKLFKPYADKAGEDFTGEGAVESLNNMVAFFDLLIETDKKYGLVKEENKSQVNKNNPLKITTEYGRK